VDAQAALPASWRRSPASEGPETALEQLFRAEYARVVRIAWHVLGDRDEAEDVAQEAFLAFHQRQPAGPGHARLWLYRTATNLALTRIRSRRRRERREQRDLATTPAAPDDPLSLVEAGERRRLVRDALARIDGRKATLLWLRYSGLSYREVADAMGLKVDQVGTLLRRAEAALERELDRAALL
jgi:RNA polymerase sigma factor (sigma-70 family)